MNASIRLTLNGKPLTVNVDPSRKLLWVLRGELQLTGPKYGCGMGLCGACTVVIDKKATRSCLTPIKMVEGKEVTTIEGLAQNGSLHPLQQAFLKHDALQCGICTPGMIMNAYGLLLANPKPSRRQIMRRMEGNLCRCGAYARIVAAIEEASRLMEGGKR